MVIDTYRSNSASRVASGIINPVTGRRIVRTWMIEELLPFAEQAYEDIGETIGRPVFRATDMLTFHTTLQMSSAWQERIAEGEEYLQHVTNISAYEPYFNNIYNIGVTTPCLLIDLHTLLMQWRNHLQHKALLMEEDFDINECVVHDEGIIYKNIYARKLILCNGINGFNNQYFSRLPYALSKGEAIIARIPGLPPGNIYKQGINIVPLHDDYFWIGSSFEWEFQDALPSDTFRQKVEAQLTDWLKLPYTIIEHKASLRPASLERRPFVGIHPLHNSIGILNGMGTKGCSLAPYFSAQLTNHLLQGTPILPQADISRFRKVLLQ